MRKMLNFLPILLTLSLMLCLALPAIAQTATPEPTEDAITATSPAPEAEATEPAPVIPGSVIIDYLESQPDFMVDVTEIAIAGVGAAYERSQWQGIAAFAGLAVVACVGFFALYRSTPPDQRPAIAKQIGGAGSAILNGIDKLDLLPMTDIENILLRAAKKAIDDKLAEITAAVDAKVQSLYAADIEKRRANAAAQAENERREQERQRNEGRDTTMPPGWPLNLVPQNSVEE